MAEPGYNGWKNRSTWNVSLWLNNDEGYYREMLDAAREHKDRAGNPVVTASFARLFVTKRLRWDRTPDGDLLGSVDWSAIAEMMREAAQ